MIWFLLACYPKNDYGRALTRPAGCGSVNADDAPNQPDADMFWNDTENGGFMHRMLMMLALASCSSASGDDVCPETPYSPSGDHVAVASNCDSTRNLCGFTCRDELVCSGEAGATSCEPCDSLASFAKGDCSECYILYVDGFMEFDCAGDM